MSTPAQNSKRSFLVDLILIGVFLAGLALVIISVREIINDHTLGSGAVAAEARVTEMRKTIRKGVESYQVRYAFRVGAQDHTYKDESGRTDLWASISREAWDNARQKGAISVEYLPADPSVNRPLARANDGLFGRIAGLVVGLLCMAPGLLWAISAIRRSRSSRK